MLVEAMARFGVPAGATVFIGDQTTDAEAARRAGVPFLLVRTGKGRRSERTLPPGAAAAVHDDLAQAVAALLAEAPGSAPPR
jgi:phosphoglycolate phosphatase-like HAD superfamily hydrolase